MLSGKTEMSWERPVLFGLMLIPNNQLHWWDFQMLMQIDDSLA